MRSCCISIKHITIVLVMLFSAYAHSLMAQCAGATGVPQDNTLTFKNTGTANITITSIYFTGSPITVTPSNVGSLTCRGGGSPTEFSISGGTSVSVTSAANGLTYYAATVTSGFITIPAEVLQENYWGLESTPNPKTYASGCAGYTYKLGSGAYQDITLPANTYYKFTWNSTAGTVLNGISGYKASIQLGGTGASTITSFQFDNMSSWYSGSVDTKIRVLAKRTNGSWDCNRWATITINSVPSITTSGTASAVCFKTSQQTTSLAYTATTDNPTSYSIDWNAAANTAGLVDQGSTAFTFSATGGTMTGVVIPANTPAGTYSGTMTITNAGGCTNTQTVTVTVNPTPSISAMTATICSGGAFSVTPVNGTNGTVPTGTTYSWSAPSVTGITGTASGSAATSISGTLTNTTNAPVNVVYTITPSTPSCAGSTFTVTVTVNPTPTVTATPSNPTICNGASPNIALTANTTGGTNTFTWTGTNGTNVSGASNSSSTPINQTLTYSGVSSSGTATYVITPSYSYNSVSCNGNTLTQTVTILASVNKGTVNNSGQTLCYGGDPASIGFSTPPSGGNGTFNYQWYYKIGLANPTPGSTDASGWTLISGATSSTYDPPGPLNITRSYAVMVDATGTNDCDGASYYQWATNAQTVVVLSNINYGTINSTGETLCYGGDPGIIGMTTPTSGGTESFNYQWYYKSGISSCPTYGSTDATGWTLISGATGASYDPPAGATSTRTYALMVDPIDSPDCGAPAWANGCYVVTVLGDVNKGTLTSGQTICYDGDPALITFTAAPSGGNGTFQYQWYYQDGIVTPTAGGTDVTGWTIISGATSATYDPPGGLLSNRSYAVLVDATGTNDCDGANNYQWATSAHIVGVVDDPSLTDPTITNSGIICSNGAVNVSSTLSGGTGTQNPVWEYYNGSSWTTVVNGTPTGAVYTNASSATMTISGISAIGVYQYRRNLALTSSGCNATSDTVGLEVVADPALSNPDITNSGIVCNGGSADLTSILTGGTGTQSPVWEYYNGSSWVTVTDGLPSGTVYTNTSTSTLTISGITAVGTYQYRRNLPSTTTWGCNATSDTVKLEVLADPTLTDPTITNGGVICAGGAVDISSTFSGGTGTQSPIWQYYDGSSWVTVSDNTPTGAVYTNTGSTTMTVSGIVSIGTYQYRRYSSTNAAGCEATSDTVKLEVVANPGLSDPTITKSGIICSGGSVDVNSALSGSAGTQVPVWEYYDGSSWVAVSNGTPTGAVYTNISTATMTISGISVVGTYQYRRELLISSAGCSAISDTVRLDIVDDPTLSDPTITNSGSICGGGSVDISSTLTGGTGTQAPVWEYFDGSSWVTVSNGIPSGAVYTNAGTDQMTIGGITAVGTYQYRRNLVVTSSWGCNATSDTVKLVVVADPTLSDPTISNNGIICSDGSVDVSSSLSGGSGIQNPTWEYYNGSTWSGVSNGTPTGAVYTNTGTATMTISGITATGAYTYRRYLTANSIGCDAVSDTVKLVVTADPTFTDPTITNSGIVCEGGSVDISSTLSGGTGNQSPTWEYYNGSSWVTVSNGTPTGAVYTNSSTATMTISGISVTGIYQYRRNLSISASGCNAISDTVKLEVVLSPTLSNPIISNSGIICSGGSVDVTSVLSDGTGTQSPVWEYYNGISWVTVTNGTPTSAVYTNTGMGTITISGISAAGTYQYRRNLITTSPWNCSATSDTVKLEVIADPSITSQPLGFSECLGGTSTLSITATGGTPSLVYQWYSNTSNSSSGGSNLGSGNGGQTTTYTPPSTAAGTFYYYCVVSAGGDGCGADTSDVVTVVIAADPTITIQPINLSECVGGAATISLVATGGTPSLTYQWYSNTSNSNTGGTSLGSGNGAQTASYTPASSTAGTYYYYCIVSASGDGCGTATSNAVTVTVIDKPTITVEPTGFTECVGGTSTLNITATGGTPLLDYQWYSNTSNSNTGGVSLGSANGAQTATYTPSSTTAGTYYYYCAVSASGDGCGSSTSNAVTVTIVADPSISSITSNFAECIGGTTTLSVTASGGTPSLIYQWYSNTSNANTGGTSLGSGSGAQTATYTPPSTTAGIYYYYCVVSASGNGCGTATSTAVAVTVVADPSISTEPTGFSECVGGTTTLSVTAAGGTPSFLYQWYSNTSNSNTGGTSLGTANGAQTATYTPPSTTAGTNYYYCIVGAGGDGCGTATSSAVTVTIIAKPSITSDPTGFTECVDGTTTLSVTATGGTPSLVYQWYSNTSNSTSGGSNLGSGNGGQTTTYTPPSTAAGTFYYYCVVSAGGDGCGADTSDVVTVVIAADPTITIQPINLSECVGGAATISLVATGGTPSLTYQWYSNTSNSNTGGTSLGSGNGAQTASYTPASSTAGTYYYYCIVSASGDGCGTATSNAVTVTVIDKPTITVEPTGFTECVGGTSTLNITATGGTPLLDYQWYSNTSNSNTGGVSLGSANGAQTATYTPSSTTAGTYYYYCVVSASGDGCGSITSNVVTVVVVSSPTATLAVDNLFTCDNSAKLSVSNISAGATFLWTKVSGSGSPLSSSANPLYVTGLTGGASTVYSLLLSNAGCSNVIGGNVTIVMPSLSSTTIASVNSCAYCIITDGNTRTFYNDNGEIIATIQDDGAITPVQLDSTEVCVRMDASVQFVLDDRGNLQPYLQRQWTVHPLTGTSSKVTLYFKNSELLALIAAANNTVYQFSGYNSLSVTKFPGGQRGVFTQPCVGGTTNCGQVYVPSTFSSYGTDHKVQFDVNTFSTFYVHPDMWPNAVLPVSLLSFTGQNEGSVNKLQWITALEYNTLKFEVQKSLDGTNWSTIGERSAVGNSGQDNHYDLIDNNPVVGNNYYRLKIIDYDNHFNYSRDIDVNVDQALVNNFVTLMPNPTEGELNVLIQGASVYDSKIMVYDILGNKLYERNVTISRGLNTLKFDFRLFSKGIYLMQFMDGNSQLHVAKFKKD